MALLRNVGAIHELPLHSVTETFSTIGAFQKTKLVQIFNIIMDCEHISAYFCSILAISYNSMLAIIEER